MPHPVTASLTDVVPSAAAVLGVRVAAGTPVELPDARSVVVVLVDGLGEVLLARRSGHAPFLRQVRSGADVRGVLQSVASCGFPSTTATSMGMFGTGLPPGAHGLVGLDVLDPDRDRLFNELAWDPDVDPHRWQPAPTVFEQVAAAGLDVVRIGPGFFDGSGLTEATLRGGRFVAADTLERRVDAAVEAVSAPGRHLVYLYWGDVDKAGHVYGCESWQWGDELEHTDRCLANLTERVGRDTLVLITADHGMLDVPLTDRVDLADDRDLAAGVRHVGGEPRALHLYCEPGGADDVLATWREKLGGRAELLTRDDAVRAGWFGPVAPHVLPRIGDVVASMVGSFAVVDSRTQRPEFLRLIGLHGARSEDERLVPLLAVRGG